MAATAHTKAIKADPRVGLFVSRHPGIRPITARVAWSKPTGPVFSRLASAPTRGAP